MKQKLKTKNKLNPLEMKKQIVFAGLVLISALAMAQKKELKKAERALASNDIEVLKNQVSLAENIKAAMTPEQRSRLYTLKARAYSATADKSKEDLKVALEALRSAKGSSDIVTNRADIELAAFNLNYAYNKYGNDDYGNKDYVGAANNYLLGYEMLHSDTLKLFNAAVAFKLGESYEDAKTHLKKLLDINYHGGGLKFFAVNKVTGEENIFNTEDFRQRALAITHEKPTDKTFPSKQREIVSNLIDVYNALGEIDKATALLEDLRRKNPDNIEVLSVLASSYYSLKDYKNYEKINQIIISKSPNDPIVYFNLGVVSAESGDIKKAKDYYRQALKVDPTYRSARINLVSTMLEKDRALVEEINNNLGTSTEESNRYDALQEERKALFASVIPLLENLVAQEADEDFSKLIKNYRAYFNDDAEIAKYAAKYKD
jgi:tetratricopeptide (TPR) repeat protein